MPTQRIPDHYATLEVPRGATSSQLRAAYRRLAKRYHPDRRPDPGANEHMRRVNKAWETLSSPSRRAEYDASVAAQAAAATRGHWAGVPRRAPATPSWAAYGAQPLHAEARSYARNRAAVGGYADTGSDGSAGPLSWAGILLIIPLAVLATAVVSAGILPFPLLGFLVLVFAGRLFNREG